MSIHVRNAGAWEEVTDPQVRVGGVWQEVQEAYVRVAGAWEQVYARLVVTLSGEAVESVTPGLSGSATLVVNADGTIDKVEDGVQTQIDSATDWIIPNGAASSDYDIRYTNHSGTPLDTAPAAEDAWVDLGSDRFFSVFTGSAAFDLEIRDGSGTTVASGSYSLVGVFSI